MTSSESFDSKTVEVDGIRFETLIPEPMITIPNRETKVRVRFGIRVTNLSPISYRFIFFNLLPKVLKSNGQAIQMDYGRNATKAPTESDFLLAKPGDILTFLREAEFFWCNYQLQLSGYDGSGGIWTYRNFKPGVYLVRFSYQNSSATVNLQGGRTPWPFLETLWTGMVVTPEETFHLLQP